MQFSRRVIEALSFQPWTRSDWEWPQLQAHRGYCVDGAPENTLAALAAARDKKFQMAEVDVRLSADGVPILFHDRDLKRLLKKKLRVSQLSAKELKKFEIPSLDEVLKTNLRPAKLNIEIKKEDRWDEALEDAVNKVLVTSGCQEEVLISSFNPLVLSYFSKKNPEIPRALLIEIDSWKWLSYLRLSGNFFGRAHMVNWPYQLLNIEIIKFLKDAGVPIATWTVNDYRVAKSLLDLGVDSVITDQIIPELL